MDCYRYGCSTHKNGRTSACANALKVRAIDAERLPPPADFIEARGLVFDLLGGPVPVRRRDDGRTVLTITLDPVTLFNLSPPDRKSLMW